MVSNDKVIELTERLTTAYEQQTKTAEKMQENMESLNENFIAHNATMTTEIGHLRRDLVVLLIVLVAALAGREIVKVAWPAGVG